MKRFPHSLAPVDSISALGDSLANSDRDVQDGELIFVRSTRQVFVYENPSTQVPDGVSIVASNFGAGNWILVPGTGGSGFSGYFNTASAGALGSGRLLDVTLSFLGAIADQTKVWVKSVRDSYTWYAARTDAHDGLLVVNPTSNGANPGRFIRDQTSTPTWMTQLAWFIDPANGIANDENSGLDVTHPLKTDAERQRRMGEYPLWSGGEYHVHYISDVPAADVVRVAGLLPVSSTLYLHGSATPGSGKAVLYTGKIDARTAFARATNTPNDITSNALPVSWTASGLVGARVRQTSGATSGAMAWIVKDLGAKKARTSQWMMQTTMTGIYNPSYHTGPSAATVNADIVVESLVEIKLMVMALDCPENFTVHVGYTGFVVDSLSVSQNALGFLNDTDGYGISPALEGCDVYLDDLVMSVTVANCRISDLSISGGRCYVYGGYSYSGGVNTYGGVTNIDGDYMEQASTGGCRGGEAFIGYMCAFDRTGPGWAIAYPTATLVAGSIWGGGGGLWGAGNSTYGLNVHSGCTIQISSAAQTNSTITGTSGNLLVGNKASLPAYDVANHNYTADRALSWAQLVQTFAGGGFGNQVVNPGNAASITLNV